MSVPASYAFVVMVWSTTPLMIQWSIETMTPIESITLRMLISLVIMTIAAPIVGVRSMVWRKNWKLYLAASIGICPAMPLVYLGAQHLPSGLVSLLFGLSPFFVGLLSGPLLSDRSMTLGRYFALGIAITGLAAICMDGSDIGEKWMLGVFYLLAAVAFFSVSSIYVKRYAAQVHPAQQLWGTLCISSIVLLLLWFFFDRDLPDPFTTKSLSALLYLSSVGSVLGFLAYFYLIKRISVNLVALIPLITPVIAIYLGHSLNGENFSQRIIIGSSLVLLGLVVFNLFGPRNGSTSLD